MFHTDSHPLCKREDCRTGGPILSAIQLKLKTAQEQSHLRFTGLRSRWEKDIVCWNKSTYDSSLPDAAQSFPFPVMSRCPWRWFSFAKAQDSTRTVSPPFHRTPFQVRERHCMLKQVNIRFFTSWCCITLSFSGDVTISLAVVFPSWSCFTNPWRGPSPSSFWRRIPTAFLMANPKHLSDG